MDLFNASALELAAAIRARHVSPVEVVDAHIARLRAVNPSINALVAERFEAAQAEAQAAEAQLAKRAKRAALPPLFGVPCTIKEFYAVEGMPNTGGLLARQHVRANRDAESVRRLRQAGAIVLGLSNVPEAGMWLETYNHVYGRTNNPWDLRRTAGGSSGGEAALVACGASPFGLATDMGGSIRIPAAFCGVIGHKPTGRIIPNTGCWPELQGELSAFLTAGPITRRVEDLMPIVRLLHGPDGSDAIVQPIALGDPSEVEMRDVTVYPVLENSGVYVWPAVGRAVHEAARALKTAGARIEERPLPRIRKAFAIWGAMLASVPDASYRDVLTQGEHVWLTREVLKLPLRRSRFTSVALMMSMLEPLFRVFPPVVRHLVQAGAQLRVELEDALGPRGVLLHPPYSRPAPRHRAPMLTPFDFTLAGIFNVLEFPVTSVPTGFTRRGLPLGVQIAARRGNDHLTMAVAHALEREFGGWTCADPRRAPQQHPLMRQARQWLRSSTRVPPNQSLGSLS